MTPEEIVQKIAAKCAEAGLVRLGEEVRNLPEGYAGAHFGKPGYDGLVTAIISPAEAEALRDPAEYADYRAKCMIETYNKHTVEPKAGEFFWPPEAFEAA